MRIGAVNARRALVFVVLGGLVLAVGAKAASVLTGRNFHTVLPGKIYRCAQPSPDDLRSYVRRHGIRTVVNLRGCCASFDWYQDESQTTCNLDLAQEDITLSAGRLPAPNELRRLVDVLDHAEQPILIHCKRGVDRTGLTATVARLLFTEADLPAARKELSLIHGHLPWGRPAAMLQFFDLYEDWLRGLNAKHSPDLFRRWAQKEYCPGPFRAHMEPIAAPQLAAGTPGPIRLRVRNDSVRTWRLTPGTTSGVHLEFRVHDAAGRQVHHGQAGLFAALVAPGESVDLTLSIGALPPGAYHLSADLVFGPDVSFAQVGGEPFGLAFTVD